MRPISQTASKVLDALTAGLEVGDARTIGEKDGAFMQVHVNRLSENTFSVAHYFVQNGDMVPDPDMVFLHQDGKWFPVSFQSWSGYQQPSLVLDPSEKIVSWYPRNYRESASFTTMWMTNIKRQQGGLRALRQAA